MKVIDLLNKIANGEEVPDEIECCSTHYYYDEINNEIARYKDKENNWMIDECYLNDEVKIIEEDKKIEKIDLSDWIEITTKGDLEEETFTKIFNKNATTFVNKINEIIDHINRSNDE